MTNDTDEQEYRATIARDILEKAFTVASHLGLVQPDSEGKLWLYEEGDQVLAYDAKADQLIFSSPDLNLNWHEHALVLGQITDDQFAEFERLGRSLDGVQLGDTTTDVHPLEPITEEQSKRVSQTAANLFEYFVEQEKSPYQLDDEPNKYFYRLRSGGCNYLLGYDETNHSFTLQKEKEGGFTQFDAENWANIQQWLIAQVSKCNEKDMER